MSLEFFKIHIFYIVESFTQWFFKTVYFAVPGTYKCEHLCSINRCTNPFKTLKDKQMISFQFYIRYSKMIRPHYIKALVIIFLKFPCFIGVPLN